MLGVKEIKNIIVSTMFASTFLLCENSFANVTQEDKESSEKSSVSAPISNISIDTYLLSQQAKRDLNYSEAISYLYAALQEDPNNNNLKEELFSLLSYEGRIDEAYKFSDVDDSEKKNNLLHILVSYAFELKNNHYKKALKYIDLLEKDDNVKMLAPMFRCWVYIAMGKEGTAIDELEKLSNEKAFYHFNRAMMFDYLKKIDEADEEFKDLLDLPSGLTLRVAQVYGNFLIRRNKMSVFDSMLEAYRRLDTSYAMKDELFFTRGNKIESGRVDPIIKDPKAGVSDVFFGLAGSFKARDQEDLSIFFIRLSLYLDNKLSLAKFLLAELHEKKGRFDKAIEIYKSETEKSDIYLASRMKLANIYLKMKNYAEAENVLLDLVKKKQDSAYIWSDLGATYVSKEDYDKAVDAYSNAIKYMPNEKVSKYLLYYYRGIAYDKKGQWELAEADFKKAISIFDKDSFLLNYLGYSWLEKKINIAKANELLDKAIRLEPNNYSIIDSVGFGAYLQHNYEKALIMLEKATALGAGSGVVNAHLGDVYWKVGRKREAQYQWRKALDVNDDFPNGEKEKVQRKLEIGLDEFEKEVELKANSNKKKVKNNRKI
ncbi:MAG: tetratricopeptide repeat protein [Alphaproteobacteria bacterium]|nr:tetratricopeptide repeat protein [Alphaproteobacteria bacterium]